jgi:AAA+ superfamily predicted ATPase
MGKKKEEYPPCDADQEIEHLIRAKYSVIYVVSWEEQRVIDSLSRICDGEKVKLQGVQVWDSARGLVEADGTAAKAGAGVKTPEGVLDHIAQLANDSSAKGAAKGQSKVSRGPLFVLCDFFRYLSPQGLTPELERQLRSLADQLRRTSIHIVIVSPQLELPTALTKSVAVIDYPLPAKEQLGVLYDNVRSTLVRRKRISAKESGAPREHVVRALMGLTIEEAEDALAKSVIVKDGFDVPTLLDLKRQVIRKGELLDYIWPDENMDAVGGLIGVKEYIELRKASFDDEARAYGLKFPRGVFFLGVQGAGKSLCAKAIARALEFPLLKLDAGRLFGELMGQSENQTRMALRLAESIAPCVLFIDEIDKALSGGEGVSTDSGTTKRVIAMILDWMMEREAPVYVVACANSRNGLPAAMLRKGRFDEMFFVDLPNPDERMAIFRIHIAKRNRDPSKYGLEDCVAKSDLFSGAEIEAAIEDAMAAAYSDGGREFNTEDLLKSMKNTKPLAETAKEDIDAIQDFAQDRLRPASRPYYQDDDDDEESRFDDGLD